MPTTAARNTAFHIVSAAEAVAVVRNGDTVFVASAAATPAPLLQALFARSQSLQNVTLLHFITDGLIPPDVPGFVSPFTHLTFFVGAEMRQLLERSCAVDYVPIGIDQLPRLVESGRLRADVALIQASRPDVDGVAWLGTGIDIARCMMNSARCVVAELNAQMPGSRGDAALLPAAVHLAIETDRPIAEYRHQPADEISRQVARYIGNLIEDESTLQIGVGQIPNEALKFIGGRRRLGIHSDLVTDTVLDLVDAGVIDGSAKQTDRGKVIASYCFGTRRLYDRIGSDPMFEFRAIDEVCNPANISAHRRMVSITQVFSIDLTGQACSDQFEGRLYGGVSAQPVFLRSAALAPEGKAIVCLASTTADGLSSRIRPMLREGEGVTVSRSDVHYVVTEYGITNLFGKSLSERALALIELAHPKYREWLLAEAKRLGHLPGQQQLAAKGAYPVDEERVLDIGGRRLRVRPAKASDARTVRSLFHAMSEDDVYTRFFARLTCLTFAQTQQLCNVDYSREAAFVVTEESVPSGRVLATAAYYTDGTGTGAEVAYMIAPELQGVGLGRALQTILFDYGKRHGIERFVAEILRSNGRMVALAKASCASVTTERHGDSIVVVMTP